MVGRMTRITPSCRPRRPRLVRDERGQGVVEFALILPVLLLVLVGILEFGSIYSNVISMRQGVREAGRQGSVANFGSASAPCTPPQTSPPSDNMQKLICYTKSQVGVSSGVSVYVKFENNRYTVGNALIICAAYPLQSLTGLFQPFLGGRSAKTKAAFRIEKASSASEVGGGDTDPTGSSAAWSWCT